MEPDDVESTDGAGERPDEAASSEPDDPSDGSPLRSELLATGKYIVGKLLEPDRSTLRDVFAYERPNWLGDAAVEEVRDAMPTAKLRDVEHSLDEIERDIPDVSRRGFLELTGRGGGIVLGFTISTAAQGVAYDEMKEWWDGTGDHSVQYFQQFWPTSLAQLARDDVERANRLLDESHLPWERFVTESGDMLRAHAKPWNDVHVLGFFFRGIERDLLRDVPEIAADANSLNFYFGDPIAGEEGVSVIELNGDREVLTHQYFVNHPKFRSAFEGESTPFSWKDVAIVNDVHANRVRCTLESLRMVWMARHFTEAAGVRFYPIRDPHELRVRGRVITARDGSEGERASFVRLEKQFVGTSKATKGYITDDSEFILEYLEDERRDLVRWGADGDPDPYTLSELDDVYETLLSRVRDRLETAVSRGALPGETATEIRARLDRFDPDTLDRRSRRYEDDPDSDWVDFYTAELREPIDEMTDRMKSAVGGFDRSEPEIFAESDGSLPLPPAAVYERVKQVQARKYVAV